MAITDTHYGPRFISSYQMAIAGHPAGASIPIADVAAEFTEKCAAMAWKSSDLDDHAHRSQVAQAADRSAIALGHAVCRHADVDFNARPTMAIRTLAGTLRLKTNCTINGVQNPAQLVRMVAAIAEVVSTLKRHHPTLQRSRTAQKLSGEIYKIAVETSNVPAEQRPSLDKMSDAEILAYCNTLVTSIGSRLERLLD